MKRYKDWRRSRLQDRVTRINTLLDREDLAGERRVALFWQRNDLYAKLKEIA